MSNFNGHIAQCEHLLHERLAAYLEADADVRKDFGKQLVEEFPEFSEELREFFHGQTQLEHLTSSLRRVSTALTDTGPLTEADTVDLPISLPQLPDYEFVQEIARGGMGIVYKARHKSLGRTVALKMIRVGDLATDDDVRRFRQEAQRIAQLDHPHIVPVYDVGSHNGRHYFTMRLMEGGSLADRVCGDRLSSCRAAQITSQMARAVHYAHQRRVLHRDIKPANILFDADETPRIGDFGLARQIDQETSLETSNAIVGTPMYMAPEQATRGKNITTAVDVYGLGAVLYELITGRPPFRADNPLDTLLQVAHREPKRPRSLNPRIDSDLETICLKCLEKQPDRRYGSAEALADDLDRWLRSEPILARRARIWQRATKWARRSPAVAALTVLSAVAVVVCMAVLIASNIAIGHEKELKDRALQQRTGALDDLRTLRTREQRLAYFQSIALAERELLTGDVGKVEQILDECSSDLRGWEWHYLRRSCHAELRSLPAPTGPTCILFHPHDNRIFVGGGVLGHPGEIAVFDGLLRQELQRFSPHRDSVTAMAVSPDGERIASAGRDGIAEVWNSVDGEAVATLAGHQGPVWSVAFSPDGRSIASAGDERVIRVWDATTGASILSLTGHQRAIWSVAFSPDAQLIASASADQTIKLWDAMSGECVQTMVGHKGPVRNVAFSPDGRRLVSAAYDNTVRVWDSTTAAEITALTEHEGFVTRAVFSPDGRRIITSSVDGTLRAWDPEASEQLLMLHGHEGGVWSVDISPDGKYLASIGEDGMVRLWEGTIHGMPRAFASENRWMTRLECSVDGSCLAILDDEGSLTIWNTEADAKLCKIPGSYGEHSEFFLSADGQHVAVNDRQTVRVFDTDDGHVLRDLPLAVPYRDSPLCMANGCLAVANPDHIVRLWDLSNGSELCHFEVPQSSIRHLSLSCDATWLAAITINEQQENFITLWDVKTATLAGKFAADATDLCFSPQGDYLASFDDSSAVSLWSTTNGKHEFTLDGHSARVRAVTFAPDGTRLFVALNDGTVAIWDVSTRRHILSLRDTVSPLDFLAFVDDQTLLGVSRAGSARRWSAGSVGVAQEAKQ